ncbi:MAG: FAD:protein FMN transferase [Rhodoferax sp.]|nr:FAD:protein FMN transferase [Rhodoferax sp.]
MARWRTLQFDFVAMVSPCSIQMDGQDEAAMHHAAAGAKAEVQRIEKKYSRYLPDSVISRINRQAGQAAIEVDSETSQLLDFADALWQMSDGLFDITSGALRRAWNFKQPRLPDAATLKEALSCVGWQQLERQGNGVRLAKTGMELDFGGFGKEYAADRAAAILHSHGIRHALVNLGGDLHALGGRGLPELQAAPWTVAITHPRPEQNADAAPLAWLSLTLGGLATSGDYERFFMHQGQRYCHVLNPKTGWPVRHWQSISVLASNTTTSGALATIAMLKEDAAVAWLDAQQARYLGALFDGKLVRSPAG